MQFQRNRYRVTINRPTDDPSALRTKAIKVAVVLSWRPMHQDDGMIISTDVATKSEAEALLATFPGAKMEEVKNDTSCANFVVVHTRAQSPDDQVIASLERHGKVAKIKDLAASTTSPSTGRPPLKLAIF